MVSDGVLVIPSHNLHDTEKHTVCWQHQREGGRILRSGGRKGGQDFKYMFFLLLEVPSVCLLSADESECVFEKKKKKISDLEEEIKQWGEQGG